MQHLRQEQLERDARFGGEMLGFIHGAHSAVCDVPNDPVAARDDVVGLQHGAVVLGCTLFCPRAGAFLATILARVRR